MGVEAEDPGPEPTDEPRTPCGTCKGAGSVSAAAAETWRRSGEASATTFEADMVRVAQRMNAVETAPSAHSGEPPTLTVVD
jgi:hypothetical protein